MYYAVVDALDEIGADSSDVQIAYHTPNFVLDGYTITAANTKDGTVEVYASNGESTYTAHLNDDGKWEFSDESTANLKNDWQDIEGATESTYTFEVTEDDLSANYRCRIVVTDEAYREENFKALEDLGNELTDEDKAGDIILQTAQFSISLPEDENSSDVATQNMPDTVVMLADTFSSRSADSIAISSDNQWITGLNGNYEYITKNMYDQVTEWFNAGKIDKATADRYWTRIGGAWSTANVYTANVLDDNKFPTGATREYYGFPLTDGDKLEVNSEWYGQTVYFRPHNDSNDWNLTGTAVSVPAYTAVLRNNGSYGTGASGTKYKDAVVFLNPWVSDAGRMYANFINYVTDNGWLQNDNGSHMSQHITVLSVNVETFNKNPDKFMMDAEGNYRIDSIGWGVCVNQEPDLSGKAYYAIKSFLSQGYGMCIGHDTMYAYAGSWYDAHEAGYTDPGSRDYYEGGRYGPDKNDTSTRYYVLNSVPNIDNGHWNMNALMGTNGGNIDSGTVLPTDAISMILSTGGSHSSYGKAGIMYGSDQLNVKLKPYSNSQAQSTVKYRNPTNFPYDVPTGRTIAASKTHSNSQVAFGPIWVDYAGGNVTGAEFGYNPNPTTKTITDEETGRTWFGTSNFYLSGTGNFLMNQIGHLPTNQATDGEASLFANTVMYISQRKQCEICAAQQNGQEDVHFVIRVSSVNAQQVLSALQAGGTFWYPLNGCYQLTDDLTLPEGWKPIKNFSGHWNADVYKVKLASNNQPVFDNTSVTANGMYTSGKNNGWNLGSDMTKGTLPILKLDNQPDVRITGVARVVGDLNALFPTTYGVTDYTGYKVVVHGSDGVDYNCVVNSDSKYVISNLPTTGMMRADVIDKSGNKVTQFGMITVDVPNHFWNDTETHPLQLMTPTADPIDDYKDWEGPVNKTVDSKLYYNEQLKASDVVWYYRTISVDNQVGDWVKIGNPGTSFDTSDGTVSGKINSLTFTAATDSDLPYTTSSVSYTKLDYTTNRIQFKCEYNVSGTVYSSMDKAEDGRNGYVDVEIRPMYIEQAFDRRISVGGSTSFSFDAFYWKGVEDGLTYEVQYRDASGNWVAVGSDSTLFPSSKYKISYVTKTDDNDALGGGVWYPSDFWVPDSFTGSDAKMNAGKSTFNKHTTVTLELSNAAMDWDGTDFRCVFTYKSTGHTMSTDTTTANDIAQARTGHLIIYAPPIEMTPLKAQSLLLNNYDSSNGNLAWTTPASNPNNGRSPKEIPLDAINPDKLGQGGKAYGAAGDNKAIYTTKITYYGNKDSAPTIKWLYSDVAGGGSLSQFKDVGDAVTLKYSDVGKKIGNISKLNSRVAELEKSFMSSGKAFNKFSGYIKLEAMYPTESKDLNNSSYAEWNAIVSLYIDNATNPMDYGNTHFYFRCQAEAQYMQNWDSADMKPYTTAATDAYNFNRDVNSSNPEDHLYKDISQSSYGAELVLDYNISIKANVPNKATKKRNTITTANGSAKDISTLRNEISEINTALNNGGAVYNYKDLAIIAPNGLRYMETYFIAGNGVNNRSGIDSRDTVVIDNKIRNSDGKCFTDLFEKVTDDEFVNKRQGFAYRSKSGNTIPKETWEWFWRNAIGTGDKPYDRTSKATLENVHIASGGLIAKDENTVKLSTTTVTGNYTVDGKNVSDAGGPYVVIRTSELSLVGNSAGNYYIEKEDLSGSITPLDLYVHSIYLEDPTYPRNVKHYDGTTKATIKDILIDGVLEGDDVKIKEETLPGNYKTKDAGQKLNADGTVSSNWPYELDENPITADAHPTLTGKDAKNYRITKEKYSGAIARANLTAQVASWRGLYGDGVGEKPWHDKKAYGYGTAASAGCWLEIDGLVQGDTLTLDQSYKKSYFKTLVSGHENLVPDESTPVGTYPLTYVGLTEANYPVLKNYIVMVLNGRFVVDPRPLHVTVLDSDKIIYNENPNFHVNIQMEDDDANLIDVVSDVDATPILDAKLKAKDTVSSVLYVAGGNPSNLTQEFVDAYDYRKQENVKESKTNIPFVTDCTISSLPLYADGTSTDDDFEWNYEDKTCDFCHYNHKLLAPYLVTINTDTKSGPALDVHTVVNPNGETVRNYELIIHDGGLYVHPALLKATVPLYVCMYGNTTSGEVKEPTNYRITNYSTVAIQIKNIKANGPWLMRDMPGMEYYPDGEYGNSVYDMTKNRLRRGELYMRLRDTVLTQGDNAIDHSDTAWVIPKATGDFINNNITGRAMQVPMAVYIATGNVNESGVCTPVTKVTYTIAPYGGVMPNDADFEKVQSQPWLKDAK